MKPRRPYLLRALYEWIVDCGEVPNILVDTEVDGVMAFLGLGLGTALGL